MDYRRMVLISACVIAFCPGGVSGKEGQLLGFSNGNSEVQMNLEAKFDSYLEKNNLRDWMKRLSARPHHVGSPFQKEVAEFVASQFRAWGFETEIEVFHVLFPTPKTRVVELVAPRNFKAALLEPALEGDATSGQVDEQLPTYNAYSIDGDVTGELVYVNQGIPADYEQLERLGIDVRGKIVIARYGGSWRGIKPKVAAEKGAIACIIYSDPRDDGYFQGDAYPGGAYRSREGVQRGSVADMPLYPGDPSTPGTGSTKDAKRLAMNEIPTLTKIPVLPISYGDALPLLESLAGPVAPEAWRGALPITYHIGPGPARVHMKLEFDWNIVPVHDVIARMEGNERPDQWIIRGNHQDAWVNGAGDPISGLVAMMEEARAIGELAKSGWRPKRSIVYAAWDAEEPGLLGSTEWVETHAELLKEKAAVYLNTDGNGRGFLFAGGSHTLEEFFGQVARDVKDPQKEISVAERKRALDLVNGLTEEKSRFRLAALGSGSDYTPFIQHLGVASMNFGYGGEDEGGEYHSIYDSFDHYVRFGDPDFLYGIALAKTGGRATLRLANADILPFEFSRFESTVAEYADDVMKLIKDAREKTEKENRLIKEGMYSAASDPKKTFIVPEPKEPVPYINFAPLENAVAVLKKSSARVDALMQTYRNSGKRLEPGLENELDTILFESERLLIEDNGLPRRPWFRHQIYAPGFYTGYGVKTLPGIREAIEERQWLEAAEEVTVIAKVLSDFAAGIDRASALLERAAQGKN